MVFCIDGNAMDCHTLDQWSGIESLHSFLLSKFCLVMQLKKKKNSVRGLIAG